MRGHRGIRPKQPSGARVFTDEFDYAGSSRAIVTDPSFPAYASSIAARAEHSPNSPERRGFSREPGPRLLDAEQIGELPSYAGGGDRTVTILVDQSGNLRGYASDRIVRCVDRIAFALESAGVPFEVLAFSTLRWKGGLSREKWVAAGKPESPGRLADLLHVVHKEIGESWTEGSPAPRERLDLMMRDTYQKEGIDGSALDWALDRMRDAGGDAGTLVMVGDASPLDDATVSAESFAFLEGELDRAIRRAKSEGVAIEAVGVLANSRIVQFYQEATYMPPENGHLDPNAAAAAVIEALGISPTSAPAPSA